MQDDNNKVTNVRRSVVLWGSAFLFVANIWIASAVIGVVAGTAWAVSILNAAASQDRFGLSTLERYLFASLFLGSLIGLLLSIGYLLTSLSSFLIVTVVLLLTLASSRSRSFVHMRAISIDRSYLVNTLSLLVVLGDLMILTLAVGTRTTEALSSPWLMFGTPVFLLFGFISLGLLVIADQRRDDLSLVLTVIHFFTAISISAIVFEVGFGFDPFVHRAAETELVSLGSIEPKQLLYTGQYVLVSVIQKLTALPLKVVDIWLVPVGASVLVPLSAYMGLLRGFKLKKREARVWMHTIFLLPLMPLTFTVPFNITFVLFFAVVFLLLLKLNKIQWGILYLVSLFAILTHPLLGVPLLLLISMVHGWNRKLIAIAGIVAIPLMFVVHNLGAGVDGVAFINPFVRVGLFLNLFIDPYQHGYFDIPQVWEAIYLYRTWIVWLLLGFAISSSLLAAAKQPFRLSKNQVCPYVLIAASLMIAVFLLSTMFVFKDIIWYEQAEFSLRLIQAISLLVLPFVAYFGAMRSRALSRSMRYLIFIVVAVVMTFAFYFSYPRLDPKSLTPGVSVSAVDVEIVHMIDQIADGDEYIVLSSQMMSAAALQEFGFRDYIESDMQEYLWYALPTGGVLYQEFLSYLNMDADRDVIDQIGEGIGVLKVYTVIHHYTPDNSYLIEEAKVTADSWYESANKSVVVFEYSY
ncbi:hypothetical protein HOI83_01850 [Candidatus Uhrbacteria bacterium]|jgi:hypothetical protein|nr:hypothetical protein [Candidatus Uhrbacteria bacterium]